MFDIGWSELVVIAVVALIAIGPKELPAVLRMVGQYLGKVRRMASEFQGQFQEAMREAEMSDLKKQVDEMTDTAKGFADFDPMASVRKDVESFAADPLGSTVSAVSPEAVAETIPAPVAPEATVPQADLAIAAKGEPTGPAQLGRPDDKLRDADLGTAMAPRPQTEIKSGGGA